MADKEKLSALMDGELVDKALIVELEKDQESLQAWQNYHLIGDVMRGDTPQCKEWNIAESVALALENEPAYNQFDLNKVAKLDDARLESQPLPSKAKASLPTWLTQFGQVAVAASVSLAVIVGVQQYDGTDSAVSEVDQFPVLQTVPFAGSAEPVSLTRNEVEQPNSRGEVNVQEQHRRINAMLQDYELQLRLNSESSSLQDNHPETVVE
ncbi:anti-sigma E factor [Vibrio sinensis]|uniref:Anti-sigma-E factor RseA n=1 Tax=Vibrio sinensis TaxID=2302434 RepID=A0A3A6R3A2_9VIBR|nr:RseA family anti-sigma factor [Vibrio sinensis]RJX70505.1 anti-sigma E factor [Vibrio sinensis]